MDSLKEHKVAGYKVTLYANRIEIEQGSFLGKKTETILLRNVSDVSEGMGKPLQIKTNDGKTHKLSIGGKAAKEWREAITAQL